MTVAEVSRLFWSIEVHAYSTSVPHSVPRASIDPVARVSAAAAQSSRVGMFPQWTVQQLGQFQHGAGNGSGWSR